ncbi:MAG: peptide-methionine (S)-S-oxide reductase MsrA [Candidatus Levybacteria bacterium]|nr:peptide-methionine (S)-S-oxide reductase MsrA [Candidatus Levybacteria bacterium]
MKNKFDTATFAGGCFWCTEAIYKRLKGVESVTPGYTGGRLENPSYDTVCQGNTDHAEAIQIEFNPLIISFEKLLDIFWHTHNPTTLNQQGNDIGTQYRSEIFYHNGSQKDIAEKSKKELEKTRIYKDPIVTKISQLTKFYPAESYHINYYDKNKSAPYCNFIIEPKIQKLLKEYSQDVKDEYKDA